MSVRELQRLASQPPDDGRRLQEPPHTDTEQREFGKKRKTWWRFLILRNLPRCSLYQYAVSLRTPVLLGLLGLALAFHVGHTLHSGLYIAAFYLLEACFLGTVTYFLGKKHCIEAIRAIANEAAVRLVALYRQNEDLVDENQELEAELHAIAQHSHPPLHAGSPADLILEVIDSMLEGGTPRPGDLLLLRDYVLSSHQENLYQPLDLFQQLHTYTMEPDVEEALCHQLLGYSVASRAPRWHSMPDNATRQLSRLSDPSVHHAAYKPRLSEHQLGTSSTKSSDGKSEQDNVVAAAQADEGLKNMLAALACDTSVLDRQNRLPGHQSSKVHLLRTSSSIPSQLSQLPNQLSQLQAPIHQHQQPQSYPQHPLLQHPRNEGFVESCASMRGHAPDQLLMGTNCLASDASNLSNLCPSPLATSSYGGSMRGSGGAYGGAQSTPAAAAAAAAAAIAPSTKASYALGASKPSGSSLPSACASSALNAQQQRRNRLRAMSSLGLSKEEHHQRARSFTSVVSDEKRAQQQPHPLPAWLTPGETLTAPPGYPQRRRPPRPSRSTSIIVGNKVGVLSPRQSSPSQSQQQGYKEGPSDELLQPRVSYTSKSTRSGETSQSQSEKLLKMREHVSIGREHASFGCNLPSIQNNIVPTSQGDSLVSSPFEQHSAQAPHLCTVSSRTTCGGPQEFEGPESVAFKPSERLLLGRGSGREGKASGAASRHSGPLLGGSGGTMASSDPRVAPTEASVYQDLIKAAQNCERHELDEAETEAAEQLCSSGAHGAQRLPSHGGCAAAAADEEVQPRSLSWSIAKQRTSNSQLSMPGISGSTVGIGGTFTEGPISPKAAPQHSLLVQQFSHPTSPKRKPTAPSVARKRRSSTGGLPFGPSFIPLPDGPPVSTLLEPIPSGRPLLAGGTEPVYSSLEDLSLDLPPPQQQQRQLRAVRTQQGGGLPMGLPVIKDLAESSQDSPKSSTAAATAGLRLVPEEHGSSGASTPRASSQPVLAQIHRSPNTKRSDSKRHRNRDPSPEDSSGSHRTHSPQASSMAALQSSAKQWMKNLLEPSSSRHRRKPVKSRTFNVGTFSPMDSEHPSSGGTSKGTLLHNLLGKKSKKSKGVTSSESHASSQRVSPSQPGSEGGREAERKEEQEPAPPAITRAPSLPLSAFARKIPSEPRLPVQTTPHAFTHGTTTTKATSSSRPPSMTAQPSVDAGPCDARVPTPASLVTKASGSRAPSVTALHCADATPSLASMRSGSERGDPSSHGASTSVASEERLMSLGAGFGGAPGSGYGGRPMGPIQARALQAGGLEPQRPLSPCSDTAAADGDCTNERVIPDLLAKQANMSRSVRARASSALSFEDTARQSDLVRSPPSQSFMRCSQASTQQASSLELAVGSFGPSKITNDSQKVVDSSETIVGSPTTPFGAEQKQHLLAQRHSLGPPRSPPVQEMEAVLDHAYVSYTFDAFHLNTVTQGHPLSTLSYYLFHKSGLISHFGMHPVKLARFLRKMEAGYRARNPYHNAIHAADVLQTLHVILYRGGMEPQFSDRLTVLAALLAAIMHDYEHMGLTNDFLINSSSKLAIRYNDRAPLENHHLAAGFTVLCCPDQNFLSGLPKAEYARMRKIVIDLVLATDMKQHFALVGQFNAVVRRVKPRQRTHDNVPGSPTTRGGPGSPTTRGDQPLKKAESLGRALSQSLATVAGGSSHGGLSMSFPQRMSMDVTETAVQQLRAAMDETSARPHFTRQSHSAHRAASLHPALESERPTPTGEDKGHQHDSSSSGERSTGGGEKERPSGNSCHNSGFKLQVGEALPLDDSQKLLVMQIALKCADLGHATEDLNIHLRWVHCLEEEFYRQGDREKSGGLPVSPLFDRTKPGVTKSQVGFFDVVILPLFQAFSKAVPGACPLVEKAEQNYRYWKSMSPTQ